MSGPGEIEGTRALDFSLLEASLLWAGQRAIHAGIAAGTMDTDDIPAWFLRRGQLQLRMEQELSQAKAGDWVFPKRGRGWVEFSEDALLFSIRFRLRWPNGKDLFERNRTLSVRDRAYPGLRRAATKLVVYHPKTYPPVMEIPSSPREYFAKQIEVQLWLESYAKVATKAGLRITGAGEKDSRLTRVREYLDELDLAHAVSRRELADRAEMSQVQLTRLFLAEYGVTPRRYLERRRFAWVRRELAHGERSIKEIAAEAGFVHPAQFSNWVARLGGVSPLKYRQQVQV